MKRCLLRNDINQMRMESASVLYMYLEKKTLKQNISLDTLMFVSLNHIKLVDPLLTLKRQEKNASENVVC